jgi:hypothetical protein
VAYLASFRPPEAARQMRDAAALQLQQRNESTKPGNGREGGK